MEKIGSVVIAVATNGWSVSVINPFGQDDDVAVFEWGEDKASAFARMWQFVNVTLMEK